MSPAPLDRGAPSQHGPQVIQKAACKPETTDVTTGFAAIPASGSYVLRNARAPACLVEAGSLAGDRDGLALLDIAFGDGVVASILPAGTPALDDAPVLDLDGGIALPRLVDMHTHLDKGHIWPRRPNPDGSFDGRAECAPATTARRSGRRTTSPGGWNSALRCAYAHGTAAILRTHLDSLAPQQAASPGRCMLRHARRMGGPHRRCRPSRSLPLDERTSDALLAELAGSCRRLPGRGREGVTDPRRQTARRRHHIRSSRPRQAAGRRSTAPIIDLHVDETNDASVDTLSLERIADAVLRDRASPAAESSGGHCCSLSVMERRSRRAASSTRSRAPASPWSRCRCATSISRIAARTARRAGAASRCCMS
jgi:cytosine deaminase